MTSLLSVSDVAKKLKADETTVRLWCRQGKFPNARQIGRGWIIPQSDLDNFNQPTMGRPPKVKDEDKAVKSSKKKSSRK